MNQNFDLISDDEIQLKISLKVDSTKQFYYLIYRKKDNCKIGHCGIRLETNNTNYYIGNIEYEIFEQYRGNNYAEKAVKLLSKVASHYRINHLLITANPENKPSIKTIENLRANFIAIKDVPTEMRLYKSGTKKVAIYELKLNKMEGKKI